MRYIPALLAWKLINYRFCLINSKSSWKEEYIHTYCAAHWLKNQGKEYHKKSKKRKVEKTRVKKGKKSWSCFLSFICLWNFGIFGHSGTPTHTWKKLHIRPFLLKQIGVGGCWIALRNRSLRGKMAKRWVVLTVI